MPLDLEVFWEEIEGIVNPVLFPGYVPRTEKREEDEILEFEQQIVSAQYDVRAAMPDIVGTSPEGVMVASAETLQTMRAGGTFNIPEGLKSWFPLILIFALVVLVIFKK